MLVFGLVQKLLSDSCTHAQFEDEFRLNSQLLQKIGDKLVTKEALYKAVAADFSLLPELIKGTSHEKASVRYGCGSVLMNLSAHYPKELYPYMDSFVALLDNDHRILVWNALGIIANLCRVDTDKKFEAIEDKYFSFLNDEYMVTVANVVGNCGKIALAKPFLIPRITNELLKVESASLTPHLTQECKRVIAEHAIRSFSEFYGEIPSKEQVKVLSFVKRQIDSSRKGLKKEATLFLKKREN